MFHSIWSKSLRDYRVVIASWGCGLALLMVAGFATATPAILTSFASIAPLLGFLGDPYAIQTPTGYITFRYLETIMPLLLSLWPILAGTRMVRGEEERGTMNVLLATPRSRVRLLLEKMVALLIALLAIALLLALGIVAGEARLDGHVDALRALLTGLNLSLFALFFGMLALLLSQVTASRGAASGGASGLLVLALLLDIAGRELNGNWLQYLSPFYYYNLNRPLIPGFNNMPAGALLLLGLSVLLGAISVMLFVRRDIGRAAFELRQGAVHDTYQVERSLSRAERAVSTRTIGTRTLAAHGWSAFWWLFGIVAFCAYCTLLVTGIQKAFNQMVQQTPWLARLFFDTPTNTNTATLGTILFTFLPALVIIIAFTQGLAWSSDLENGRMELVLSTPQARPRLLLERFGANVLIVLLAPVLTWLTLTIGAWLINLNVDQGKILAASFSMLPPALITLSLIYVLAGRLRYSAVLGLVTAYLVLAFLEETLEGLVSIPSWVGSLSIFHLYGNPIFVGMDWGHFLGMLGVALALLLLSLVQFRYVDIERG